MEDLRQCRPMTLKKERRRKSKYYSKGEDCLGLEGDKKTVDYYSFGIPPPKPQRPFYIIKKTAFPKETRFVLGWLG